MRLGVRRMVSDGARVEHDDIREIPRAQEPAAVELQVRRGESGHAPNDVFQWRGSLLANEPAQDARERSVGTWVRLRSEEDALRRERPGVGPEATPRQADLAPQV